jgi:hypothetical protein
MPTRERTGASADRSEISDFTDTAYARPAVAASADRKHEKELHTALDLIPRFRRIRPIRKR